MPVSARQRVRTILESAVHAPAAKQSAEELLPILYDELRALARARLAQEKAGATLQATALVHEAWLRLVGDEDPGWSGRAHFFGAAALAMQRILVERARGRAREKRGGGRERVGLEAALLADGPPSTDLIDLVAALGRLEARDARKAEVVRLRYFAGLSNEEVAGLLGRALATVKSDWAYARAWLHRELAAGEGPEPRRQAP